MPRNLNGLTDAVLLNNIVEKYEFVKIVFPSPTGTLRFCNKDGGFTGNIDGASQTWNETDVIIGPISMSTSRTLEVAWVKFANLDYSWTNYAFTPGIRECAVSIYDGWFDPTVVPSTFITAYQMYAGLTDEATFGQYAQISLRPHYTPWNYKFLPEHRSGKCINIYRNMEDCQFTGAEPAGEVTCNKTRTACVARANTIHINIYDEAPRINEKITWGNITRQLNG